MSIIQKIREKYIGVVFVLIILALIGFLLMDALQNNLGNMVGGRSTNGISVNGTEIPPMEIEEMKKRYVNNMMQGKTDETIDSEQMASIEDQAWKTVVNNKLITEEAKKLGIEVTTKELQDMLTGDFADEMVMRSFTDPKTGIFDPAKVKQYINVTLKQNKEAAKEWIQFEKDIINQRFQNKYIDLIKGSIYFPKVLTEKNKMESGKWLPFP